ncbi:hypothetical protein [Microbispora sp. H10949]|uniref:hypothetical protein n=1 Tax=Microbispora sp. H10949 TaxID=2729111 RepID=UPI001603DF50|nr:hypothetical protein [Microbispora sp. H10949]
MRRRFEDLEYWAEADSWADASWMDAEAADGWTDADDWDEPGLGHVLREALHEDYADADDDAYDDAIEAVLDGMSAAEAFSFEKALRRSQRDVSHVMANPLVGQGLRTALPAGAGALGTLIGGPAGTAIGSKLGTLAAGALTQAGKPTKAPGIPSSSSGTPAMPPAPIGALPGAGVARPAVADGSAAAAQGLVLTQQPDVLKALLALSMGQHGARQVSGVPVASVMNLLSSVFGQAAADADELAYLDGEGLDGGEFGESGGEYAEPALGTGRSLYTAFMDIENEELAS